MELMEHEQDVREECSRKTPNETPAVTAGFFMCPGLRGRRFIRSEFGLVVGLLAALVAKRLGLIKTWMISKEFTLKIRQFNPVAFERVGQRNEMAASTSLGVAVQKSVCMLRMEKRWR